MEEKEIQGNIHVLTRLCKNNRKDKPETNEIVFSIPKAVITRDRVAYNHRNFISPGSRGQKCKTKVPAGPSPLGPEGNLCAPPPGSWLPHPHLCLCPLTASLPWGSPLCPNFSPESPVILGLGLTLTQYDLILIYRQRPSFQIRSHSQMRVCTGLWGHTIYTTRNWVPGVCASWGCCGRAPRQGHGNNRSLPPPSSEGWRNKAQVLAELQGGARSTPSPASGGLREPQLGDGSVLLCSCLPLGWTSPFYKDTSYWITAHPNDL